jgi:hypothetical protein
MENEEQKQAIAEGENTKEVAFALDISHQAVKPIAVRSCGNPNPVYSICTSLRGVLRPDPRIF